MERSEESLSTTLAERDDEESFKAGTKKEAPQTQGFMEDLRQIVLSHHTFTVMVWGQLPRTSYGSGDKGDGRGGSNFPLRPTFLYSFPR